MTDQQPYPYPQATPPPAPTSVDLRWLLGARMWRRPEPRFGTIYAGAGAALVTVGGLIWAAGYLARGFSLDLSPDLGGAPTVHGQARRFLGAGLFLALVVIGYLMQVWRRTGAVATAGTVLSLLGVPLMLAFVSFDLESTIRTGSFPVNVDLLFLISMLVWLVSYLGIPGSRGRAIYLAAALTALPSYIIVKAVAESTLRAAFNAFRGEGGAQDLGHSGAAATIGLVFGIGYYLAAWLLDRSGRAGVAAGVVYPAFVTTASGVVYGASSFHRGGTGVLLILIGTGVALYAGRYGRRVTAILASGAATVGVVLVVSEIPDLGSRYWLIGVLLIASGALIVVVAAVVSTALGEPPDILQPVADPHRPVPFQPSPHAQSSAPMPYQQNYPPEPRDDRWPPTP